jgi:hypothetical protein
MVIEYGIDNGNHSGVDPENGRSIRSTVILKNRSKMDTIPYQPTVGYFSLKEGILVRIQVR